MLQIKKNIDIKGIMKNSNIKCKQINSNFKVIKTVKSNNSLMRVNKRMIMSHQDNGGQLLFLIISGFMFGVCIQFIIFGDEKCF